MTTPKDLIPTKYEVLKLQTGAEVVGMTRDLGDQVEITLPMICQLNLIPGTIRTQATFYPYAPLSGDMKVTMPVDNIIHRNTMNEQFVPYYDEASSRWFDMIENKTIPLATEEDNKYTDIMRKTLQRLVRNPDISPLDRDAVDSIIEDEIFSHDDEEFYDLTPPKDKNKLH